MTATLAASGAGRGPRWPSFRAAAFLAMALALSFGEATASRAADEMAVRWSALPGWESEDHGAAFRTFRLACPAVIKRRPPLVTGPADARDLVRACKMALALPETLDGGLARDFFERSFRPVRMGDRGEGFLTGYYEPEVAGSKTRQGAFVHPLYAPPQGIAPVPKGAGGALAGLTHAHRGKNGRLRPLPDRAAIDGGALAGRGLELVWLSDPVEVFFAHVQGSTRVRFAGGEVARFGFAARNGHPYTPVGRVLIERGEVDRKDMTAGRLAAWLRAHPDEAPTVMAANASYIFFRKIEGLDPALGPIGALGIPLVAGRSLAVDPKVHPLGVPVYVAAELPETEDGDPKPFRRLMVAADTGAAIRGGGRGDVFFGSGLAAQHRAGPVRHSADLYELVPGAGDGG